MQKPFKSLLYSTLGWIPTILGAQTIFLNLKWQQKVRETKVLPNPHVCCQNTFVWMAYTNAVPSIVFMMQVLSFFRAHTRIWIYSYTHTDVPVFHNYTIYYPEHHHKRQHQRREVDQLVSYCEGAVWLVVKMKLHSGDSQTISCKTVMLELTPELSLGLF